jgi:hypothetical protein
MKKMPLPLIGLLQALGLGFYCSLVGIIFWKGNAWFGNIDNSWGPLAMLSLFVVSALICALIALGYPFLVFWDKKNTKEALKLISYTAAWLLLFVIVLFTIFALT